MQEPFLFVIFAMVAFFALIVLAVFFLLARPWLSAFLNGTPVSLIHILAMRLRGNPPVLLIDAYIALNRAGIAATMVDVEKVYLDGKNHVFTSDDLVDLVKKILNVG